MFFKGLHFILAPSPSLAAILKAGHWDDQHLRPRSGCDGNDQWMYTMWPPQLCLLAYRPYENYSYKIVSILNQD